MNYLGLSSESKVELEFFKEAPPLESDGQTDSGDWVACVKLSKDLAYAGNYSGFLQCYKEDSLQTRFECFKSPVKSFDISNDSGTFAVVSKKGEIKVLDSEFNLIALNKIEHLEKVTWNPLGSTFAVGSYSGQLSLCKISELPGYISRGLKRQEIEAQSLAIHNLEVSHTDAISEILWPTIETLITSSMDHNVFMIDLESAKLAGSILCPRVIFI